MSSSRAEYPCAPDGADVPLRGETRPPSGTPGASVSLPGEVAVTIVVVSSNPAWHTRLRRAGASCGCVVVVEPSIALAAPWVVETDLDSRRPTAVLALDRAMGEDEILELAGRAHCVGVVALLVCETDAGSLAAQARRRGIDDVIDAGVTEEELWRRLGLALESARAAARLSHRVTRLKRICRRLSEARRQVVRQMDAIWTDLVGGQREHSTNMNQLALSSEYGGLIRHELDLEVLLRTTLEYVLGKSGPTNAAVFLPATSGDFSLGAYVNYDCPKETVDILLDHMANVVAPRFEHIDEIAHLTDPKKIMEQVVGDAQWIGDSHVIGFSCKQEGECLAIFLFFRDAHAPYPEAFVSQLRVVRDLFAAQLARVIRIHHRHLPKEKWGALGDPPHESDDGMV